MFGLSAAAIPSRPMRVTELPALEVSGLCSATTAEQLIVMCLKCRHWGWVCEEVRNRRKLVQYISNLEWMDSSLLKLLYSEFDLLNHYGARLLRAATYVWRTQNDYAAYQKRIPQWVPPTNTSVTVLGALVKYSLDADFEEHRRRIHHNMDLYDMFENKSQMHTNGTGKSHEPAEISVILLKPVRSMTGPFLTNPSWRRVHMRQIRKSKLVEICFLDTTMKRQEKYFWNVIKMTASLMTSCQVLSIRLRYPRTAAHERDVIWRDMYERILQKGNSWLLHLPLKWTMHFSFDRHYGETQVREWMCDIYSEGCNCQNNRKKRQKPLN